MQVMITVPDEHIDNALSGPHCRYWAREMHWDGLTGYVVEAAASGEGPESKRYPLTRESVDQALMRMAQKAPRQFSRILSGDGDGITGDVLLQFMAFGEMRYDG